jgi:uncharacterized protein YjiK/aryl carrier-like protein
MAIQITEYSYSSGNGEFVEFTNTGTTAVDMTGYSFDDNSRISGSFSLSGFGTVKPGESVIITETVDVAAFRTAWGLPATVKVLGGSNVAKVVGGSDQTLQRADEINLYDASNVLVDRLTYDDATITGSPRTQNVSAYTDPANLGKNDASKWKLSTVGDIQGGKAAIPTTATTPITDIGSPGSTLAGIDLSRYTRVGRYNLPEPTRTTAPDGSLLAQEASGVTYDWDTDTLFIVGDAGTSVVQVDKTGKLIDSMTLAKGNSPQGTVFYDLEGIAYIGGGKFVMTEERDRQVVSFTYKKDTTLTRADTQTVKLGTTIGNIGLEGLTYDPSTGGYIIVKEDAPQGIFQTTIDFAAGTASNGSPTAENSVNLFDPAKLNLTDLADVYALSNVTALSGKADSSRLIVLSQASGKILNVDRSGTIYSSLTINAEPRDPSPTSLDKLSVADQSHEGVTVDKNGNLYVVSENGGGSVDYPQLWVYAPSATAPVNQAPTAVAVGNIRNSIADKTSTATRVKLSDINITDDGLGINNLTLSGTDASSFEIFNDALYVKAGTTIDYATKNNYSILVNVDDPTVGSTPDLVKTFILEVSAPTVTPVTGGIFVTEVAPWSSGNSPVGADWFELTNTSKTAIDITGWKFDDSSNSFAGGLTLNGVTSIGAGESVVFVEVTTATGAIDTFKTNWFGPNVPAGFRIGSYAGTGNGLSTGGDAVNIYNATGDLQANVVFGASPAATPFATFDNAALQNNATISTLSAVGVKGGISVAASATSTEIGSPGSIGTTSVPVTAATRNDFNGDGKSDILWRSDIGGVAVWQMNGATVTNASLASTPSLDNSWKTAGTGDFNGDSKSDILWRNDSGAVAVWTMNGSTITASNLTSTPSLDNSWKTAGTGDFNGDSKSDILWRNDSGEVAVWTMNGSTITASNLTSTPSLDNSWKTAGTGDFNGDGKTDILWRNDDGSVALWQMNGASIVSSTLTSTPTLAASWKAAGTGDFNGDGKSDILWRNDDGSVALWQMNGSVISSSLTSTPSRDSSWKIAGTGDFSGDSKADILWRKDSGATDVWTMNGSTVVASALTSAVADGGWRIAAPII